ncbi:MAG: histidine decarboxylase, pyruvoyl type [Candidatus Magasanikbacteria bacterium]
MFDFSKDLYASSYNDYCTGYLDEPNGGYYTLLTHLSTVSVNNETGVRGLDHIVAFDKAEVDGINLGQFNMITVSSFCGPNGKIAGYDFLKPKKGYTKIGNFGKMSLYDGKDFLNASKKILGTVNKKKYPIKPGSHVPCAAKYFYLDKPGKIFSVFSISIPKDRKNNACLLMENVGEMLLKNKQEYIESVIKSIEKISENQNVEYKETFIAFSETKVKEKQTGCALVLLPYIKLAKNIFIK